MRPLTGHRDQGTDAWHRGCGEVDNPYRPETLAHHEWLAGHLDAMIESGDLGPDLLDEKRIYLMDIDSARRIERGTLRQALPTLREVADAIGVPVSEWPTRCYEISTLALESGVFDGFQAQHGGLFVAYGIYQGPIDPAGPFGGRRSARHGWLESVDGFVVDLTRWVFASEAPMQWAGPIDDYDLAALRARSRHRPFDAPAPEGSVIRLGINDPLALAAFDRVLRGGRDTVLTGSIAYNRLHWLLTSDLETMGADAPMFISTADRLGHGALVPLDVRRWVESAMLAEGPSKPVSPQAAPRP